MSDILGYLTIRDQISPLGCASVETTVPCKGEFAGKTGILVALRRFVCTIQNKIEYRMKNTGDRTRNTEGGNQKIRVSGCRESGEQEIRKNN